MIKMPLARAKAVTESFPTLVCELRVFFKMRRTQATGGSNSTAEGRPVVAAVAAGAGLVVVVVAELSALGWFSLEADDSAAVSAAGAGAAAATAGVSVSAGVLILEGLAIRTGLGS